MIVPEKKCIFIHVPKVGGTTIRGTITECRDGWKKANREYGMHPHMDIMEVKQRTEPAIFSDYFKFGFVRNPWDRAVSIFVNRTTLHGKSTFKEFLNVYHSSTDFCNWPSEKQYQLDWFTDYNGNVLVDFIGRFENFDEDLTIVCEKLNIRIPDKFIHARNHSERKLKPYQDYYENDEMVNSIARKFWRDIEYFGYRFG